MPDIEKRKRLTIVVNQAPLYREPVYRMIEEAFDCKWVIGADDTDIKQMDTAFMRDCRRLPLKRLPKGFYKIKAGAREALKTEAPDNILMLGEIKFATSWAILLANRLRCRKRRRRITLWTHGYYGNENRLQKLAMRTYYSLADRILFYNERSKDIAVANGIPEDRCDVIHNSLDHDLFRRLRENMDRGDMRKETVLGGRFADPSLPCFTFIGRLTSQKKLPLLLEAMHLLKLKGRESNLILIGDGPVKENLMELARKLEIEKNVFFMGECYDHAVSAPYIYVSDACVSPGEVGLTALHALELGTPVVTHDDMIRQMPEAAIVNPGVNGLLFKAGDSGQLAEALGEIADKAVQSRSGLRSACVDSTARWTPQYQLDIISRAFRK